VENGLEEALKTIAERVGEGVRFIGIGGGTGSGKTYLANGLSASLGARVIEMDDYYKGKDYVESRLNGNYDEPGAIDIGLIVENIKQLKSGRTARKPVYDMKTSSRSGYEDVKPGGVFIINGLFALSDELAKALDLKVYIQASRATMLARRIERDRNEKRRLVADDTRRYFDEVVWPMHQKYVEPTRANADIIVTNG